MYIFLLKWLSTFASLTRNPECIRNVYKIILVLLRVKKACEAFFLKEIILMPIICIDSAVQCCPDDIAVRPAVYLYNYNIVLPSILR